MAHARRRQQRAAIVSHAGLIWRMFDPPRADELEEFIRCGDLPQVANAPAPPNPDADKIEAAIYANGGRLIFEDIERILADGPK